MSYLIKVTDHINKSERIIHRLTTLDTYNSDFQTIINYLSIDNEYQSTLSNGVAELTKNEQVVIPGYFYNSTKNISTLTYTLTLIKVDEKLSNVFLTETTDSHTQTEESNDLQTKETQCETSTKDTPSQVYAEVNKLNKQYEDTEFFREDDEEFGEFQSYTPEFTNVDLNSPTFPCYDRSNVIIPPYQPYSTNPFQNNSFQNNPFQNIMNLRGDNEDVHFTFGSQVPKTPTQVVTNWAPELVHELKFRLAQPNAGLVPTNSSINYYL
jgi:hypothetical protein